MITKIMTVAMLVLLVGFGVAARPASADGLLIQRADFGPGMRPYFSEGVILPEVEIWGFGLANKETHDFEIGRTWRVLNEDHFSIYAGGYFAYWPDSEKSFFVPWVTASAQYKRVGFSMDIAAFVPFNGGPFVLYNNEAFLGYRVSDRLRLGVATSFWDESAFSTEVRFGPALKWKVGRDRSLNLRYLFGHDGNDRVRVQFNQGF